VISDLMSLISVFALNPQLPNHQPPSVRSPISACQHFSVSAFGLADFSFQACQGVSFARRLPIGKLYSMKTTVLVDEVGRMVLPKSVRDAIGICGRTSVNVEVVAGAAQISPLEARVGPVARQRGRTLYTGPLPSDWDSGEAVFSMRERRIRK
jgi:bifunctional DNA-binding transcriptional regulator/antitoxin component of YhaV-PrlF toxin-antitoxin module